MDIGTNKWLNFKKNKNNKYQKSEFGVSTRHCNMWCYTTWHGVTQILNYCLGESIPYSLYAYSEFICISCRRRIISETPINDISHMFNERHIRWIYRPQKKLYLFCWQKPLNIPCNIWAGNTLLKHSSSNTLNVRKDFEFQHCTDVPVCVQIIYNRSNCDCLWCAITSQTRTGVVRPLWCSIMHPEDSIYQYSN